MITKTKAQFNPYLHLIASFKIECQQLGVEQFPVNIIFTNVKKYL